MASFMAKSMAEVITARAPGKLYIAGEYAVVDGREAIISAVDRYITVRVWDEGDAFVTGDTKCGRPVADDPDKYIRAARYVCERYVRELQLPLTSVSYAIDSELVEQPSASDAEPRKFGLGSSGAVVVAFIRAHLEHWIHASVDPLTVYKLAVIAHVLVEDNGSFGDIACSAFGQLIRYRRPDTTWCAQIVRRLDDGEMLTKIVTETWPQLEIEQLQWPDGVVVCIGWTGNPARSAQLIDNFAQFKQDSSQYEAFVDRSEQLCHELAQAYRAGDAKTVVEVYSRVSRMMVDISERTGNFMETSGLRTLRQVAESEGFVAKFSGAGGGDCGIAMTYEHVGNEYPGNEHAGYEQMETSARARLHNAWKNVGIEPMDWTLL